MKAALRDAKRADAIKNRPKQRVEKTTTVKVACYVCGSAMVPLHDAKGGICGNCMGKARAARDEVKRSREAAERVKGYIETPKPEMDWKPKRRKHEKGYGSRHH